MHRYALRECLKAFEMHKYDTEFSPMFSLGDFVKVISTLSALIVVLTTMFALLWYTGHR